MMRALSRSNSVRDDIVPFCHDQPRQVKPASLSKAESCAPMRCRQLHHYAMMRAVVTGLTSAVHPSLMGLKVRPLVIASPVTG
jgi:hypothetical protein